MLILILLLRIIKFAVPFLRNVVLLEELLKILQKDPFQNPPPFEKLVGDLAGAYSRRINIQHRLVYQVHTSIRTVKIIRLEEQKENKWGGQSFSYKLESNGVIMSYDATENVHTQLSGYPEGSVVVLRKESYVQDGQPRTAIKVFPEGSLEVQPQNQGWVKKAEAKDWDKINDEKDEKILRGQARNHAVQLLGEGPLTKLPELALELYRMWKLMDWEKTSTNLGTVEDLALNKTHEEIEKDLPF